MEYSGPLWYTNHPPTYKNTPLQYIKQSTYRADNRSSPWNRTPITIHLDAHTQWRSPPRGSAVVVLVHAPAHISASIHIIRWHVRGRVTPSFFFRGRWLLVRMRPCWLTLRISRPSFVRSCSVTAASFGTSSSYSIIICIYIYLYTW